MKLDLTPVNSTYVAPTFGSDEITPLDAGLQRRLRRPMIIGGAIIAVLVVGLGLWASFSSLATGVSAAGEVRVEANRKTVRHKESGTIRQILVHEGQHVRVGQPLIIFNDVEVRAASDVYQNQVDTLLAQAARFDAEAADKPTMAFSPDLTARSADPRVSGLIRDQEVLFATRLQLYQSQTAILNQRIEQIQTQIEGDQAQVASVDVQRNLTAEEMAGYQTLYDKGFAPKPLILRYQRSIADLDGRKGSLNADIAKLRQQMGETRMQMAATRDTRTSQAAEGLRDTQAKLSDTMPRLTNAREQFDSAVVRSPADGYVFSLSQFTVGGVTGSGEVLMEIVPANAPLIVTVAIKPDEVEKVRAGMDAQVRITGLNQRWHAPLKAKVILVSADKISNDKEPGRSYYRVDLRIDPVELTKLQSTTQITPGMPAQAMIVTGSKTVMGSLISPITDTLRDALHD